VEPAQQSAGPELKKARGTIPGLHVELSEARLAPCPTLDDPSQVFCTRWRRLSAVQTLWILECQLCGGEFLACPPCGLCRRYCSDDCAAEALRFRRREANRRHQQSEEGRADHRDRQRAYRDRRRQRRERVTDRSHGNLAGCEIVARDDGQQDFCHGQVDQPDAPCGPAALGRGRAATPLNGGPSASAARTVGIVGRPVLVSAPRCAFCGLQGDRVEAGPRRWPWLRPFHSARRGQRGAGSRSPPRGAFPPGGWPPSTPP